ncbi:hypothetical protein [Evansella tamaricis]|uniref:Uncharacterized protein n=1 Tax=Evansella tamaricis TaxID=2069301 RepID=A0ABS6JJS0_9BACI|nr:hypothetical protein [Evansella tamaricis]MBU9713640.1 hypothetical protein [Evansella tamaricis]
MKQAVTVCMIISVFIGLISLVIGVLSFLLPSEVYLQGVSGLFLFALATFLWIIPLQVIEWLRFVRVQRRGKRILFPYFVTLLQVSAFVFYLISMNGLIQQIEFTNKGLVLFAFIMVVFAKIVYKLLSKTERKTEEKRRIS